MESVLAIAGSDSSGGAGIQADLKTMTALGVYGQTAITALTAQNTLGVQDVYSVEAEFLSQQLESVFSDIEPQAIKIGMIPTAQLVEVIADFLKTQNTVNVVLDPVMVATSGASLSDNDSVRALVKHLITQATVLTPNIPEAEALLTFVDPSFGYIPTVIETEEDMKAAARAILSLGCQSVLVKGGHSVRDAHDFFLSQDGQAYWLRAERIKTDNTHGTGCTLSSAIASFLAKGYQPVEAILRAKGYLTGALSSDLHLGKGNGPVNHMWALQKPEAEFDKALTCMVLVEEADK